MLFRLGPLRWFVRFSLLFGVGIAWVSAQAPSATTALVNFGLNVSGTRDRMELPLTFELISEVLPDSAEQLRSRSTQMVVTLPQASEGRNMGKPEEVRGVNWRVTTPLPPQLSVGGINQRTVDEGTLRLSPGQTTDVRVNIKVDDALLEGFGRLRLNGLALGAPHRFTTQVMARDIIWRPEAGWIFAPGVGEQAIRWRSTAWPLNQPDDFAALPLIPAGAYEVVVNDLGPGGKSVQRSGQVAPAARSLDSRDRPVLAFNNSPPVMVQQGEFKNPPRLHLTLPPGARTPPVLQYQFVGTGNRDTLAGRVDSRVWSREGWWPEGKNAGHLTLYALPAWGGDREIVVLHLQDVQMDAVEQRELRPEEFGMAKISLVLAGRAPGRPTLDLSVRGFTTIPVDAEPRFDPEAAAWSRLFLVRPDFQAEARFGLNGVQVGRVIMTPREVGTVQQLSLDAGDFATADIVIREAPGSRSASEIGWKVVLRNTNDSTADVKEYLTESRDEIARGIYEVVAEETDYRPGEEKVRAFVINERLTIPARIQEPNGVEILIDPGKFDAMSVRIAVEGLRNLSRLSLTEQGAASAAYVWTGNFQQPREVMPGTYLLHAEGRTSRQPNARLQRLQVIDGDHRQISISATDFDSARVKVIAPSTWSAQLVVHEGDADGPAISPIGGWKPLERYDGFAEYDAVAADSYLTEAVFLTQSGRLTFTLKERAQSVTVTPGLSQRAFVLPRGEFDGEPDLAPTLALLDRGREPGWQNLPTGAWRRVVRVRESRPLRPGADGTIVFSAGNRVIPIEFIWVGDRDRRSNGFWMAATDEYAPTGLTRRQARDWIASLRVDPTSEVDLPSRPRLVLPEAEEWLLARRSALRSSVWLANDGGRSERIANQFAYLEGNYWEWIEGDRTVIGGSRVSDRRELEEAGWVSDLDENRGYPHVSFRVVLLTEL